MQINIITSFVIGGLLLIALFTLHNKVHQRSYTSTIQIITSHKLDTITELIEHDMRFFGFGYDSKLLDISDNKLQFQAQIYGQTRVIQWHRPGGPQGQGPGTLRRIGPLDESPGSDVITFDVTHFKVAAFTDEQATTPATGTNNIKSIMIEVEIKSDAPLAAGGSGSTVYYTKSWRKLFIPNNIQF